jgi:hypothetical protein
MGSEKGKVTLVYVGRIARMKGLVRVRSLRVEARCGKSGAVWTGLGEGNRRDILGGNGPAWSPRGLLLALHFIFFLFFLFFI